MNAKLLTMMAAICLMLLTGCRQDRINSTWHSGDLAINGDQGDWEGSLKIPKDKNIAIGLRNNDSNLYVTLSTTDQAVIMRTLQLGLTVWFDPKGGTREVLGVKYPVGAQAMGMRTPSGRPQSRDGRPDLEQQIKSLQGSMLWVELLGPDKDDVARCPVDDTTGIQVRIGWSLYGQFVYELRVPLDKSPDNPFALDVSPGETIGVGFKTGEMERADMRSQRPGGGMPGVGTRGGGRNGGMSGGGMRGGGMGRQRPEPFRYWAKVTLADNPQ